MTTRPPIPLPARADDSPRFRYWGDQKPPKNALILCQATPRLNSETTKATIRMYGPIDPYGGIWGTSSKDVAAALDDLPDSVTELQLRINSPGGSCFEAITILNTLRAWGGKVTAVVDGLAASAASLIAAGCDDTIMSPGAQMMVHGPSGLVWGTAADMRETAGVLDKIAASMASIYSEATGAKPAEWLATMTSDTWYTAEEAVEAGLADEVAVVPDAGQTSTAGAKDDESDDDEVAPELDDPEGLTRLYVAMYASTEPRPAKPPTASADGLHHTEGGSAVAFSDEQMTNLRAKLGTSETADEATILAALDEALEEQAEGTPPVTAQVPEGMTLIESGVLAELRAGATAGKAANDQLRAQARDAAIDAAIRAGKTTPARRDHWVKAYDADPEGTKAMLDSLEPGLAVPTAELGNADDREPEQLDSHTSEQLDAFGASFGLPKGALL